MKSHLLELSQLGKPHCYSKAIIFLLLWLPPYSRLLNPAMEGLMAMAAQLEVQLHLRVQD
jgi:hypothetical protein